MDEKELAYLAIGKLKMRFQTKINHDEYYLSYSGGNDSHVLYWFIKEYMKYDIKVVALNTYREHKEISKRMYKYADEVIYPTMKMDEIKEKYGSPCFTKMQDEIIERYQRGNRTEYTLARINGTGEGSGKFGINKIAKKLVLNGELHKVSNKCCLYTKKKPLKDYEKQTGLKPIIAVRGSESILRKTMYTTCLSVKGHFTPMFDITDEMVEALIKVYNIPVPKIYDYLTRTGCIGCPYGRNIEHELSLVTKAQKQYAIKSFGESYAVKGIDCLQQKIEDYEGVIR